MKNKTPHTLTQDSIRKVRGKDHYKVVIAVLNNATGKTHSKSFLVFGSKSVAKGQRAMQLRNLTQTASVVNI